jgi:2-keto-3-deoxy-L-rhamnonate aldolase RhmA
LWQAFERVAKAAKTHGIHWAILPRNATYAQRCVDMGCRMLSLGMDIWMAQRGVAAFKTEFAKWFTE